MNKCKNIMLAVAITLGFGCIVLLLFHPSRSPLGSFFDVFIILIVTHYVAIVFGIVVLLLRLLKIIKENSLLIYVFAGTLNVFLAVAGITLVLMDRADMEWLHKSNLNLFVGFLIMADMIVFSARVRK